MATIRTGSVHFPFEEDLKNESLLRASTVEDIIAVTAITVVQAQGGSK